MADLNKIVNTLKKKFESTEIAGNMDQTMDLVSCSNKALDLILDGGVPFGYMTEFLGFSSSGKSLFIQQLIANAQKKYGAIGILIDRENAYINKRGEQLGIDNNQLIVVKPQNIPTSTDAFVLIIDFITEARKQDKDTYIVVGIDSISAFGKDTKLEKSDSGRKAKAVHEGLRELLSFIDKRVMILVANQFTYKIGVCFSYKNKVILDDFSQIPIGKIVNNKIKCNVLSYNTKTKEIESKPIINWFYNGREEEYFLNIILEGGRRGQKSVTGVTKDHYIFTPNGEKKAKDLIIGDEVLIQDKQVLSEEQHEIVLGSILGDGNIRFEKSGFHGNLRINHCYKQKEYCLYKASLFDENLKEYKNYCAFDTKKSIDYSYYKDKFLARKGLINIDQVLVNKLTRRAVAIWYMDDGTFSGSYKKWGHGKAFISTKIMNIESLQRLAKKIEELGLGTPTIKKGKGFLWSGIESKKFQDGIKEFVPKSMSYKLKYYDENNLNLNIKKWNNKLILTLAKIKDIKIKKVNNKNYSRKYDIEVKDNNNYFIGGVLVHNSYGDPRTSTSGESMKYYGTVRIALEDRKKIIDESRGGEVIGNWIGAEVIKTRLGPCNRDCYLPHFYKTGIDYYGGYARLLVDRGYLEPKNKTEFKSFKQYTVRYGDRSLNEFKIEKALQEYPELDFSEYPDYNVDKVKEVKEEVDE